MISAVPVLAVLLAACATAPAAQPEAPPPAQQVTAPVFDPVGVYDFTTTLQGTSLPGVLTVRRGDQGLTASIHTDVTGEIPIQEVGLDGRRATLRANTAEGAMVMRLEFLEDNRITGGWELSSGLAGSVTGRRRTP